MVIQLQLFAPYDEKKYWGELVKWNATRFGTNYMFLESIMRKKDQFMQWMVTSEFRESRHFKSEMGQYAFQTLTSLDWWNNMKYVLDDVEPLYSFLRFADQDKVPTLGEVHVQYQNTKLTYSIMNLYGYIGNFVWSIM